jgi:hypothetical protein
MSMHRSHVCRDTTWAPSIEELGCACCTKHIVADSRSLIGETVRDRQEWVAYFPFGTT